MAYKVSELNRLYPHDCPTLNQVREQYAGWSAILDKNLGYIRYYRSAGGRQTMHYEHHLVARAAHGAIPAGYHVHHVNEQRTDNRAANLQVLSPEEHGRVHAGFRTLRKHGHVGTYVTIACSCCGTQIVRLSSRVKSHNYCNPACQRVGSRKVKRPTTEELSAMLCNSSYEAIGRQFGVTGKAVKKWAVLYGLA